MEKRVSRAFQPTGAALDVDAHKPAGGAAAKHGKMVDIEVDIVRHHQVDESVPIVVGKGCPCGPATVGHACCFGYIGERAIAVVAIQNIAAVAGDVHVWPAVIVVIRHCSAHGITRRTYAGLVRDVGERAVVVVMVERATGFLSLQRLFDRGTVREVNVQPPVAVVIQQQDTRPHGLDDVASVWRRIVGEANSGFLRDVLQLGNQPILAFDGFGRSRWGNALAYSLAERLERKKQSKYKQT